MQTRVYTLKFKVKSRGLVTPALCLLCPIVSPLPPAHRRREVQSSHTAVKMASPAGAPGRRGIFRALDMYRKLPADLAEGTILGSTVSLVAIVIMLMLFLWQVIVFTQVSVGTSIEVRRCVACVGCFRRRRRRNRRRPRRPPGGMRLPPSSPLPFVWRVAAPPPGVGAKPPSAPFEIDFPL